MVTFVGSTSDQAAGGSSLSGSATGVAKTGTIPGLAAGDVLIAVLTVGDDGTISGITMPAGFTTRINTTGPYDGIVFSCRTVVATKQATGAETSFTANVSQGRTVEGSLVVYALRGVASATPGNTAYKTGQSTAGPPFPLPSASLTTVAPSDVTVYGYTDEASFSGGAHQSLVTFPSGLSDTVAAYNLDIGMANGLGWRADGVTPGSATVNWVAYSYVTWALDLPVAATSFSGAPTAALGLSASTAGVPHRSGVSSETLSLRTSATGASHRSGALTAALSLSAKVSGLGSSPTASMTLSASATTQHHGTGQLTAGMRLLASVKTNAVQRVRPGIARRPQWRYHAQDILTGEWLHRDLPLSGVQLTWKLSGPSTMTAAIDPDLATAKKADGSPLLNEWATAIYAEEGGVIRHGSIVYTADLAGPSYSLTTQGFAGYPSGMPYDGPDYSKTEYDPLDVVRDLWAYIQSQPDGNLGMVVDSTKSTAQVGNVKDDSGKQLTVPGQSTAAGVQLNQYAPSNSDNQSWKLGTADADGWQTIQGKQSKMNIGVAYGSTAEGAAVIQYTPNGSDSQLWKLVNHGTYYQIQNKHSGMVMNVSGASVQDSAPVIQWPASDAENSSWIISTPDTDGFVTIANMNSGKLTPYALNWWNNTDMGTEINTLAQTAPFDYAEEHAWADDARTSVSHRLRLGFPRMGTRQSALRFAEGENVSDVVTVQRHGDAYANAIIATGAGQGSTMLRSNKAVRDGRLRRVLGVQDATLTDPGILDSIAQGELDSRQNIQEIVACTVRQHPNAVISSFGVGDDILVTVNDGWAQASIWSRITSYVVQPDDPTFVQLTLVRSDRFRYAPGQIQGSTTVGN